MAPQINSAFKDVLIQHSGEYLIHPFSFLDIKLFLVILSLNKQFIGFESFY